MNADWLWTIFWSIIPISELRGGIPFAFYHNLNPVAAYFVCVLTNLMAFPIVYFFVENLQLYYLVHLIFLPMFH